MAVGHKCIFFAALRLGETPLGKIMFAQCFTIAYDYCVSHARRPCRASLQLPCKYILQYSTAFRQAQGPRFIGCRPSTHSSSTLFLVSCYMPLVILSETKNLFNHSRIVQQIPHSVSEWQGYSGLRSVYSTSTKFKYPWLNAINALQFQF